MALCPKHILEIHTEKVLPCNFDALSPKRLRGSCVRLHLKQEGASPRRLNFKVRRVIEQPVLVLKSNGQRL
jgi:hypothetical protein